MTVTLDIEYLKNGFRVRDLDTGKYVECYERRYKSGTRVTCTFRNPSTGQFEKGFEKLYLQYIGVYEQCYENGCRPGNGCKQTNNLHIECHKATTVEPQGFSRIEEVIDTFELDADSLEKLCKSCFKNFGQEPMYQMVCFRTEQKCNSCFFDRCQRWGEDNEIDEQQLKAMCKNCPPNSFK